MDCRHVVCAETLYKDYLLPTASTNLIALFGNCCELCVAVAVPLF